VSHYKYHVFFCCNQREPGAACCTTITRRKMRDYAKARVKVAATCLARERCG